MRRNQKPPVHNPVFIPPTAMRSADDPPSKACLPVRRPTVSSLPSLPIPSLSLSSLARTPRSSPRSSPRHSPRASRAPSPPLDSNYTELLVLIHGLQGNVEDFNFFASQLDTSPPALAGALLVHASTVNTERTHDGVPEGASRLADDIRRIAARHPSLTHLSLVGFSLGGVYARYVAAILFADGELAGLVPQTFATVAAPNLGVRSFGMYRFLPAQVFGMTKFLLGKTGDELVLNDGGDDAVPLLVRMSKDSESGGLQFASALRAFRKRICYGNMQQDFMVNFGTAVLDHSVNGLGGPDVQNLITTRAAAANAQTVDPAHDGRGCKVAFTYTYPARDDAQAGTDDTLEAGMAKRLQALGWDVVAIDFPNLLPITHNMIMANSKNKLFAWMNAPGQRAVLHLVDNLVSHHDSHEPLFQATSSPPVATSHAGAPDSSNDSILASMIPWIKQ